MKKYKFVKTWIGKDGKRKVVRADDQETLDRKYYERRYGNKGESVNEEKLLTIDSIFAEGMESWKKQQVSEKTFYDLNGWYRRDVQPWIGEKNIKDISYDELQKVLNRQKGKSQRQINQIKQILYFIYDYAITKGYYEDNYTIVMKLKKPKSKKKVKRRALTDKEVKFVMKYLTSLVNEGRIREYCFISFLFFTGCRPSEILKAKYSDLEREDDKVYLHIPEGKTDAAERHIPINRPLEEAAIIHHMMLGSDDSLTGVTKEWEYEKISKKLKSAMVKEIGPTDFVMYDFRHNYCTGLRDNGTDIRDAKQLMGHSTLALTADIYTHDTTKNIKSAFDAMEKQLKEHNILISKKEGVTTGVTGNA